VDGGWETVGRLTVGRRMGDGGKADGRTAGRMDGTKVGWMENGHG